MCIHKMWGELSSPDRALGKHRMPRLIVSRQLFSNVEKDLSISKTFMLFLRVGNNVGDFHGCFRRCCLCSMLAQRQGRMSQCTCNTLVIDSNNASTSTADFFLNNSVNFSLQKKFPCHRQKTRRVAQYFSGEKFTQHGVGHRSGMKLRSILGIEA